MPDRDVRTLRDLIWYQRQHLNRLELKKTELIHDLLTGKVRVKVETPVENIPS